MVRTMGTNFSIFIFLLHFSFSGIATQRILTGGEIAEHLKLYQTLHTLSTSFHQTKFLQEMGIELKSEGKMELIRPDKVVWKVTSPSPLELVLDKRLLSMTMGTGTSKKTEQFSLDGPLDPSVSKSLFSLIAWLKVDVPVIQESYTIFEIDKRTFKCVPKEDKLGVFQSLTLFLHKKGHLEKLFIEEKSGDRIELRFSTPTITFKHT